MPRIKECHDDLIERELSNRIIGAFYHVYNGLGYGFLESVYRNALAHDLVSRGLHVATEVPAAVKFDGEVVGQFRADILVESRIVLELKAIRTLSPADEMQVLNYLRATDLELGILLHFGPKPAYRRFVCTNRPRSRQDSRSFASSASASGNRSRITAALPPAPGPSPVPPPAAYPTP